MNDSGDKDIVWCEADRFHEHAASLIKSVSSVLDIGCGIRPQQFIQPELLICVEPHLEYVEILKRNLRGSNAVIVTNDAISALRGMPDCSVDSIFLIDVIEHMEKDVGALVVKECERVARQQIIIFTPLGFMPQEVHAGELDGWNLHGGEWQVHKSGWYPEDFPGWSFVACKHLHTHDYLGQAIDPPYGGFYAIRNKARAGNIFNELYSQDTLGSKTSNLPWLNELYPDFVEKVVSRDIENSVLRCGLMACQRTTELQIELKSSSSIEEITSRIALETAEAQREEARRHHERMQKFASQFTEINDASQLLADVKANNAELKQWEASLESREAEMAKQQSLLESRESELAKEQALLESRKAELAKEQALLAVKEAEVQRRAEEAQTLLNSSESTISKRIRKLFK